MNESPLILCATTRLAQYLRSRPGVGMHIWQTPRTATLGQWLAELAEIWLLDGGESLPQLLDGDAERLVWESVIHRQLERDIAPLFDLEGMAKTASEAHAMAEVWGPAPDHAFPTEEQRQFQRWREAFVRKCDGSGWVDPARFQARLLQRLALDHSVLPAKIVFAGFDRFSPFEHRLQAVLQTAGCVVEITPFPAVDPVSHLGHVVVDVQAECEAVAAWARHTLNAHPAWRLGIVVPDLEARRHRLECALDDVFHPEVLTSGRHDTPRVYNFSLGMPLGDQPLVRVALDWLGVCAARGRVEQKRLSQLLLSSAWSAGESEADARARLDARIRQSLGTTVSLEAVIGIAASLKGACPKTLQALRAVSEVIATLPRKAQSASQWMAVFTRLLAAVDWPGERILTSQSFQVRQAFLLEVERFSRLDQTLGSVPFSEAVRQLTRIVRQRLFQPQTRGEPSIQVLGVLESAGLQFDALWVMGMNDDLWPPSPSPNPLLPLEWQRHCGTPRACAEVELTFARQVHARLAAAAPRVHFSWAEREGHQQRRPSPLLGQMVPSPMDWPVCRSPAKQAIEQAAQGCEWLDDALAPPVAEGAVLQGGVALLKAQAICPAWAFYSARLGARALDAPVDGLDAAARGTLVHGVLEAFWRAVGDSDRLHLLDAQALKAQLDAAIEAAIVRHETDQGEALPSVFRVLEAGRLFRLMMAWLPFELAREIPFVVEACEEGSELALDRIRVKTRVDRIDRLADGRRIVIDYKTGSKIDMASWASHRIAEPQLPLYAAKVLAPTSDEVAATVFARVQLDDPGFSGIASESALLAGVQGLADSRQKLFDRTHFPDWTSVLTHWQRSIDEIAREIGDGVAGVMIEDPGLLIYCDVLPLLRLPEWEKQRVLAAGISQAQSKQAVDHE